jgi:eukaryotic-like serine/threonine-protein kinase
MTARGTPTTITRRRPADRSRHLLAGRYRLQGLLGRGGMGDVWLARDEVLARPVAIKEFTLPEAVLDRATATARVFNEAQAAAQVTHRGVVRVYDLAVDNGNHWIVMEALTGQTLADAIWEQGRLDVGRVVEIAVQLLEALQAMHREGVIHRDVKPSNVQLSRSGRVVLTDFGLATRGGIAAEPGEVLGSPPYMAPEAILEGRFGPASDMYSLGATLYAAVEGREPLDATTSFSTLDAEKNQPPLPVPHAGFLRPVIQGLLTKDPDRRLGSSEAHLYLKTLQSEQ